VFAPVPAPFCGKVFQHDRTAAIAETRGAVCATTVGRGTPDLCTTCRLIGDVDSRNADGLAALLRRCIERGEGPVTVDCSRIGYVGAPGVRMLLEAHHYARAHGRRIVLFGVPPELRKIADVAGIAYISRDDMADDDLSDAPRYALRRRRRARRRRVRTATWTSGPRCSESTSSSSGTRSRRSRSGS
jgi:anti-anti-sigma factor